MNKRLEINEFRAIFAKHRLTTKTNKAAYELAEEEWISLEGERKYKGYNSFRCQMGKYKKIEASGKIVGLYRVSELTLRVVKFLDLYFELGSYEKASSEYSKLYGECLFNRKRRFTQVKRIYLTTGRYAAIKENQK